MNREKIYVEVILRVNELGETYPLSVIWEDGRKFEIDKITDVRRACATKTGGTAIRYTVRIKGRTSFLYEDEGKWYVESR